MERVGTQPTRIDSYQMIQLILEALAIEKPEDTPWNHTFQMYNYAGSMMDLFAIVEHLCLLRGLITEKKIIINGVEQTAKIPRSAWGCGWHNIETDTSFYLNEQNIFFERFHYLINQQVISPGWVRNSENLPFFHVTDYGLKCLESRDILPYDTDGYITRIQNCSEHTVWDVYYIQQCLGCYNSGLYDAATMMLGIESEYLANRLIEKYKDFLTNHEPAEKTIFDTALSSTGGKISREYDEYSKSWRKIANKKDSQGQLVYPDLNALKQKLDIPADSNFMTYLRQTRNELAHPSQTVMEPSETMLLIVSFLKYFEIQNEFLKILV